MPCSVEIETACARPIAGGFEMLREQRLSALPQLAASSDPIGDLAMQDDGLRARRELARLQGVHDQGELLAGYLGHQLLQGAQPEDAADDRRGLEDLFLCGRDAV